MALSTAIIYLRLSSDDKNKDESESITNQRMILRKYCENNSIRILKEFSDDGYSGGNTNRPAFQEMLKYLEKTKVDCVLTKDLSRLGRDMREASYYAEQVFPELGVRYVAINDNFDSMNENTLAPFQFAMNDMYLREVSRKVKSTLKVKRDSGQYCACPPYGYMKSENGKTLVPDPNTAPIVKRIFSLSSSGKSTRAIAEILTAEKVTPPLAYRIERGDSFTEKGASRATNHWVNTTVKRILVNDVYLGHTVLGKTQKLSPKSKKKIKVAREKWAVTENTHEALVSEDVFQLANKNLAYHTKRFEANPHYRQSIFADVAYCGLCGHAICSSGTVYKEERKKYWYLSCNNIRFRDERHCDGSRIKYSDFSEIVRNELNALIKCSPEELAEIASLAIKKNNRLEELNFEYKEAVKKFENVDKIMDKLYDDFAEEKITEERFDKMLATRENESHELKKKIKELEHKINSEENFTQDTKAFYNLAKEQTEINELTRDIVLSFIDKIIVYPKELEEGFTKSSKNAKWNQKIEIYYKFLGKLT